ncbi:uncharacterized protein EI90DRAFT_394816 [Cantharellus anzutake]|uniref:uncharacterized protein n=1 Tax=Cantharellus anzutake TaxID=1750568 RepID=UPI00190858F8|nr:uncharacterized protein EI90DRAFT_394816 [Cantharellus anzutake]KAF8335056.1 hypothetical protein EI90DRAFT_394816 [Cantharellus anzutake]
MSSLVSVAGSSIQLVLNAYYLVKTNRDRCHKLVERCESLVAMLQQVVDQRGEDIYDRDRIERLQEAFEHIAIVIVQVGTRSWMQAYLQSDGDNVILEGCHRRISDLISLFNLRELIDVGNNQAAHNRAQVAVSKQNEEELSRLKSVNGDIVRQLKAQQYLLKKLAKKLSASQSSLLINFSSCTFCSFSCRRLTPKGTSGPKK